MSIIVLIMGHYPLTLSELLLTESATMDQLAVTRLGRDDQIDEKLNRQGLVAEVERLAARLAEQGLAGAPVLIPEKNSIEYVVAFLACLRAGSVAVTAHPPRPGGGGERLKAMVEDSRPAAVIATPTILESIDRQAEGLLAGIPRVDYMVPADPPPFEESGLPLPDADAVGLLQYTSGSTRNPRPVMVSQANLLANASVMRDLFGRDRPGGTVCWMPLYHDMGLIGLFLCTLLMERPVHLMDPESFVIRPERWLRAMTNTGAAYSGGPCFAYDLCVDRIPPERREGLDLSAWKFAFNGAEPIRPRAIRRFQEAFGPHGFEAAMPCYGLAESTLLVSVRREDDPVRILKVDRSHLEAGELHPVGDEWAGELRELVSCGLAIPDHEVVIRNPDTGERLPSGKIGEITIKGPSVALGFQGDESASAAAFPKELAGESGPWLKTGDLGGYVDDELLVVGRLKDLLIVDGRNIHPSDIEAIAEQAHSGLSANHAAAFAMDGDAGERIGLVVELDRSAWRPIRSGEVDAAAFSAEVVAAIRSAISGGLGVAIEQLLVVAPGEVPRTTSGKVRRGACRDAVLAGVISSI